MVKSRTFGLPKVKAEFGLQLGNITVQHGATRRHWWRFGLWLLSWFLNGLDNHLVESLSGWRRFDRFAVDWLDHVGNDELAEAIDKFVVVVGDVLFMVTKSLLSSLFPKSALSLTISFELIGNKWIDQSHCAMRPRRILIIAIPPGYLPRQAPFLYFSAFLQQMQQINSAIALWNGKLGKAQGVLVKKWRVNIDNVIVRVAETGHNERVWRRFQHRRQLDIVLPRCALNLELQLARREGVVLGAGKVARAETLADLELVTGGDNGQISVDPFRVDKALARCPRWEVGRIVQDAVEGLEVAVRGRLGNGLFLGDTPLFVLLEKEKKRSSSSKCW